MNKKRAITETVNPPKKNQMNAIFNKKQRRKMNFVIKDKAINQLYRTFRDL